MTGYDQRNLSEWRNIPRPMSRAAIFVVLICYFFAALAFGIFLESQRRVLSLPAATIGAIGGTAISLYLISGIVPIIVWAFSRFNPARAKGPLVLWACVGVAVAYVMHLGSFATATREIDEQSAKNATKQNLVGACVARQNNGNLNRQLGITSQQISAYCQCYAEHMIHAMTAEEWRALATAGNVLPSMSDKIAQAGNDCSAAVRP